MNGAGRWWRLAAVAVVGGGVVVGGWAGLSRSATAEPAMADERPAWAPSVPAAPAGDVIPAVAIEPAPPTPAVPRPLDPAVTGAPPTLPVFPPVDPVPSAPPVLPVLPALPSVPMMPPAEVTKPAVPPVAPVVPVLPPSVVPSAPPPVETAPPPSPAKSPEPARPNSVAKPDSGLQGGNTGNTVKTENPGVVGAVPMIPAPEPVVPPVPPVTNPAAPPPAVPAVGSPGGVPGTLTERAKPAETFVLPIPNTVAPTPGDTTVTRTNQSVAAAVLGGAVFALATPAPAAAQGGQTDKTTTEKLDAIQKDLKTLTELLNGRKDKDGYPIESSPGVVAELKKLNDRLAAVETELNKMKTQSSSLRPANPGAGTPLVDPKAAVVTRGVVRVVNEYPVQISIVVNGTSYRVAPSKTLDVEVPAGEFSYQLLESGAASTRSTIKEKETVTLRIK